MAQKSRKAREVDGTKGQTLVTVKLRLPAEVLQGMREESLGRSASLSSLVVEYFRGTPRRFWLQERSASASLKASPSLRLDAPEGPPRPKLPVADLAESA